MPALVVLGIAGSFGYGNASSEHTAAQHAACGDLPAVSGAMYAYAYAAVVCSVLAIVLCLLLRRTAVRHHWALGGTWQGRTATVAALLGTLALVVQVIVLWWLYQPDPSGVFSCAG